MKCAESNDTNTVTQADNGIVHLPYGLLGFEQQKKFVLFAKPEEAPFARLQMIDDPTCSFLVVPPEAVLSDYRPDIHPDDITFLGIRGEQDARVLNIVTLRENGGATVNLKGPILINRATRIGKQIIPVNAADYSVRHALPAAG